MTIETNDTLITETQAGLTAHDELVAHVYIDVSRGTLPYSENPGNAEQRMANDLLTIFYLGEKIPIYANGLTGIYARPKSEPSERGYQGARRNLASVILEGNVRPAKGYTPEIDEDDANHEPYIDNQGNIIDVDETQAFCAPLKKGNFFDSAGEYGPYWVVFNPETVGIDRSSGIPKIHHKYYLVPDTQDRDFLVKQLDGRASTEDLQKIITYNEFVAIYSDRLPQNWAQRQIALQIREKKAQEAANGIEAEVKTLSEQQETGLQRYLEGIIDPNEDSLYRQALLKRIRAFTSLFGIQFFFQHGHVLNFDIVKHAIFTLLRDPNAPDDIRISCASIFLGSEGALSDTDKESLLSFIQDKDQPESVRRELIYAISRFKTTKESLNKVLGNIVTDEGEAIQTRHDALFHIDGDAPGGIELLLRYLRSNNEQERKIAMYKLSQIATADQDIIDAVNEFSTQNARNDIAQYIKIFTDRFSLSSS